MLEKHLKRIKKAESGLTEEDEWEEIPSLGQKLDDQIIDEVPDRSIIVSRIYKNNLDSYEEDAPKIKDAFSNTAQYSNLVRHYVEEKKSGFDKFKKDYEQFDKEIAVLNPCKQEIKFDINKLDDRKIKVTKLKQELVMLETQREEIKNNLTHFKNQINQAQSEYNFKVEQIKDIELELHRLEKKEALQNKIKTEQEAIEIIKKELDRGGDLNESKRIFRTVNILVDLLNEKNKITLNELNSVKDEFKELQKKYVEVMSKLK
jgi:chromosome segregation ATPase